VRSRAAPVAPGLIAILTLAAFTNRLNVVAWNPFLPFIADAHGISVGVLGQVPALMLLLSALLGLVIGPLADRYGYRLTLLVCLLAVATGSLATGLSTKLFLLVLAGVLGAVGRAAIMPVAQAIATVKYVDETARRRTVSRIQSGGPLAATLGIPLLTVIAGVIGWQGAFVVLSGLAFMIALILSSVLRREEKIVATQFSLADIASAYRPILRDQSSRILVVAACLENTGVNVTWTYYGAFYVQQHGFGVEQVGWVSLAAGLGVLLGQTAAGTRFGGRPQIPFRRRLRRLRVANWAFGDACDPVIRCHYPHGYRVAAARAGHGQYSRPAGRPIASRTGDNVVVLRLGYEFRNGHGRCARRAGAGSSRLLRTRCVHPDIADSVSRPPVVPSLCGCSGSTAVYMKRGSDSVDDRGALALFCIDAHDGEPLAFGKNS
jgi:predicted MFS family arabinose efflux permease